MNYLRKGKLIIIILFTVLISLFSCKKDNEDLIPAYIHIDSVAFSNNTSLALTSSHAISDVWIYIDDNLIGAFELPCTVPVLYQNKHTVMIKPGIKLNGIASTRTYYPLYNDYINDFTLVKDSVLNISVSSSYSDLDDFAWIENFEIGLPELEEIAGSDTTMIKTSDPSKVFEGSFSGLICLTDENSYCKVATTNAYDLPKYGNYVFLELNYKTNNEFLIGLYANATSSITERQVLFINPKETWNKIYINLTNIVSEETNANDFKIIFIANKDAGVDKAEILLDNIQLIYIEEE
jgi:hypothetical protein